MSLLPTLGQQPRKSPLPKVIAVAVVVGVLAGGAYTWRQSSVRKAEQAQQAAVQAAADAAERARLEAEQNRPATPVEQLQKSGLKVLSATINGPLETAIVGAVGPQVGAALTQVVTRSLVWWVDVPGDLRRGDRLEALYEERAGQEPLVHAVRFESQKSGKTFKAFLFKSDAEKYPRFFEPAGEELEQRLQDSPIDDYEQVTSLLRDGRRHKGVDFKAPEGTPVRAPFDGVITRRNWNFRGNGNSLELREASGRRTALFLHLSELPSQIQPNTRVKKGQEIAKSGNTGRSFAPHLHYQLMASETKVLDPFVEHPTYRRKLPEAERSRFDETVQRFETLLGSAVAGAAP
jgi:murein DD-endopeptidase